ncbi:hypothetical protein BH721_05530 [Clostridium baratii]|uniref:DUF4352 domain-containing protein n=1 Tax=Clostridium baratii TaxID=1561 RepID=UPI0009A27B36|nr:DUF4352 domain-containing protein [Clostridium baratii]OPF52720.1 hypothetical protein A1M12_11740 [Clostridium baratii]OPF56170.1 hypothetical protein BH721_05530 [Clostridium baratii]OPF58235.1 hypothetical protein BH724_05045 [Clostridium baratii]OPF59448.1 hypothetical protein BH725_02390 [Clostridium baratii]
MSKNGKKPIFKKWWFWLLIVVIIGGVAGSITGESDEPSKVASSESNEENKENNKPDEKKEEVFKIGDTVKVKDYEITVNKVSTSKGNEISKPANGNEFLKVDITIKNISDKEQTVSSVLMFKVVDKEGRECKQEIFADSNGTLDGQVGAGRKITGEYTVEVPKNSKGLELEFNSSFIDNKQVIVKLN